MDYGNLGADVNEDSMDSQQPDLGFELGDEYKFGEKVQV